MDVMDQQGRRMQIPRAEYARQMMEVAKQNWESLEAMRQMAPNLLNDGFIAEALKVSERAHELSGGHVPDLYWLSASQAESGLLDKAAAGFMEIQEDAAYASDQARASVGLARVRVRQGKQEEAEELLKHAITIDPDNPQFLVLLYGFYNEQGRGEEGLKTVRSLATAKPERASSWRALSQIAVSMNDGAELKRCAYEALKTVKPEEKGDLYAEVSYQFGQLKMPEEIINLLEPIVKQVLQPFALMNLAQAFYDVGRREDSMKLMEAILRVAPEQLKPTVQLKIQELKNPQLAGQQNG